MLLVSSRRWKNADFFGGGVWSVFNRSPKMPQCAVWSGPHWPGQGSVSRDTAQRRGGSGLLGSLSLDSRFKMFSCVPPPSTPQAGGCGWDAARPGVQAGKVGREAAGTLRNQTLKPELRLPRGHRGAFVKVGGQNVPVSFNHILQIFTQESGLSFVFLPQAHKLTA